MTAPAPSGAAPPTSPEAWPACIPALDVAYRVLTSSEAPPELLKDSTERYLSTLALEERSALVDPTSSKTAAALCKLAVLRWRLFSAASVQPKPGTPLHPEALNELFQQAEDALGLVGMLEVDADEDVRTVGQSARKEVARLVGLLLTVTDVPTAPVGTADKRDKEALAQAMKKAASMKAAITKGKAGRSPVVQKVKLVLAVLMTLGGAIGIAYSFTTTLVEEKPIPAPELGPLPPGTEMVGNPASGNVIVRSTNGKPLSSEAVEALRQKAKAGTFQRLGPTQVLIGGPPPVGRR